MQIIRDISNFSIKEYGVRPIVLSIGNFDGVHRGHQYLIQQNIELARVRGWKSAILTFTPHPIKFLKPDAPFELLFDKHDCVLQLEKLHLDYLILQDFDRRFSLLTAADFVRELFTHVPIKAMILGPDFCFGLNRSGNLEFLKKEAINRHFELFVPEVFKNNEEIISTSGIKKKLQSGDIAGAKNFLGRNYYLNGEVVRGDQRGRLLGFPTANIFSAMAVHLRRGVYVSQVFLNMGEGEKCLPSITNIGLHPTFGEQQPRVKIETHIFDFNQNIYGKIIKVELLAYLREEKKFQGKNELVQQIHDDIRRARSGF